MSLGNCTQAYGDISHETFLDLFRNLDVQLMVTDLETDEILFANEKMNRSYRVDYDPRGRRCWETYRIGQTERCAFCPLHKLKDSPKEPVVWTVFNSATNRWFRNTSSIVRWTDGRLAHFEQGVDITKMKRDTEIFERRLHQQQLMCAISQSFISSEERPQVLIEKALESIGSFLGTDRIQLIRFLEDGSSVEFQCAWLARGVQFAPEAERAKLLNVDVVREAFVKDRREYLRSDDTASDRETSCFAAICVSACLAVPVWVNGILWGMLSMEMSKGRRKWDESDIYLGQMVSNAVSSVLYNAEMAGMVHEADERTQSMLDAMPLACTFINEDCQVIDCNEEAVRMHGLASKQEYLDNFYSISPEYQPDGMRSDVKMREKLNRAFQTGQEVFEWTHIHRDGTVFPVEVVFVRVKWKNGYRMAGYARDLRKLKAQMAEIEKTQADLRLARDKAEDSAKAKSNFLANMSHEIRTPMNAIIGMTDLALNSNDIGRIKYCLSKVDDAANHLLGVINDILDMSKIEAGKLDLAPTDFLLDNMLQRVTDIADFRAEQKHQDLLVKVDKTVPAAIVADQQRIAQVLTNLLSNAVKFTPDDGKIQLLIHNTDDHKDHCTLLFEVTDTGIGLSKEQQARLFQSFEQADGSISRRFGGTGLGLAISRTIIDLMGGTIGLESEPQKGSRFYFSITVPKGNANYLCKMRADIDWKHIRLMVVDDSLEVREYFEDIAAAIGVYCRSAMDGDEAFRLLKEEEDFHILFIDWLMPGIDGIELTRRIRREFDENVVVIMISIANWEYLEESASEAGVNHFMSKPLFPSRIIDCINECMGAQDAGAVMMKPAAERFFEKHILLAEDIEINREIIIASLDGTGLTIDCAENGRIACEKFEKDPYAYDLILMDIHMPEMDGFEATRRIRAMNQKSALNVPIVAMTANVFREDVEKCLEAGMDDHVGKPVDIDELIQKIERYI